MPPGLPAEASAAAEETLGGATVVAEHLAGPVGAAVLGAARSAYVSGMHVAVLVAVGAALLGALVALIALPRKPIDQVEVDAPPPFGWPADSAGEAHREAGDAALEPFELRDVDEGHVVSLALQEVRRSRRGRRHEHGQAAEQDDVGACRLGYTAMKSGHRRASSTVASCPMTVPSGRAMTADLRCSVRVTGTDEP